MNPDTQSTPPTSGGDTSTGQSQDDTQAEPKTPVEETSTEPKPEVEAPKPAEPEAKPAEPEVAEEPAPAVEPEPEPEAKIEPEPEPEAKVEPEPEPAPEPPAPVEEAEEKPAEVAEESAKATEEAPAEEKPTGTADEPCECPTVKAEEWDKKKTKLEKMFYKTFSPRAFYYPFSMAADIHRATQGAEKAGYKVPESPMIMDTGGMFWSTLMVEVEGAKAEDKNVVSLSGKEVYTKVSTRPWKEIKTDIEELKQELGGAPAELYFWYTSCPKCTEDKDVKTVLVAVPAAEAPAEEKTVEPPAEEKPAEPTSEENPPA